MLIAELPADMFAEFEPLPKRALKAVALVLHDKRPLTGLPGFCPAKADRGNRNAAQGPPSRQKVGLTPPRGGEVFRIRHSQSFVWTRKPGQSFGA